MIAYAPISMGELVDKITILQIKRDRIEDKSKLVNINYELNFLNLALDKSGFRELLFHHMVELRLVNEELWQIEDSIRKKEKLLEFDEAFISLARNVYQKNDLRSTIKSMINQGCGSAIVEEKSYEGLDAKLSD